MILVDRVRFLAQIENVGVITQDKFGQVSFVCNLACYVSWVAMI